MYKKKGARDELLSPASGLVNLCDGSTTRGTLDLSGVQASSAHLDLRDLPVDDDSCDLEVRLPDAARSVVGVRDIVTMRDALVAYVAAIPCDVHLIHQLDTGHLGAIALAMSRLENSCVTAGACSEFRPDLTEQFIVDLALVHVTSRETTIVQSSRARLRDELLDERPKLLRARFRRFDRATLDQRARETTHQRQLLLGSALE